MEKVHPAPRITTAPPEPPPLDFLQRQQKFPERGVSANSNRAHSRLCGPPAAHVRPVLGFLRARCSWSTLNKGNSNVTATVNLLSCSCQQDIPNQSRNKPHLKHNICFVFFPLAPKLKLPANHKDEAQTRGQPVFPDLAKQNAKRPAVTFSSGV